MSEVATVAERRLPTITAGAKVQPIIPGDFDSAYRIAQAVCAAGMAPKGLETPERAFVAIMHGLEVGLPPMQALQSIAVINGRPSIWGDGAIGLVRGSGLCEAIRERLDGEGDERVAICEAKRRGERDPIVGRFSVADAKRANLWSKAGPWKDYPQRMLQMRARAFALRDGFADVLRGLHIAEEMQDIPGETRDITPPSATLSPPSPPKASPPTKQPGEPETEAPGAKPQPVHVPLSGRARKPKEEPESPTNADDWLDSLKKKFAKAKTISEAKSILNNDVAPFEGASWLMPEVDWPEAIGLYESAVQRLTPAEDEPSA